MAPFSRTRVTKPAGTPARPVRRPASVNPYSRFGGRALSLNDFLAIDRTVLANERTLLAYGRTSIAMLITGGSALKFFESPVLDAVGGVFIASSVVVSLWGWRRYARMQRNLAAAVERETGEPGIPGAAEITAKPETTATNTPAAGEPEPR